MAAMNASLRGLSVTQETVRAREAGPTRRHASRWQVLKRFASVAALASAMTDPQIAAMLMLDRLERERHGR